MKKAAALRYDAQKESAPRVIAKGQGQSAENIIKIITNGLKKKMEIECLLTARKYNWNWAIKKIEEVYLYAA